MATTQLDGLSRPVEKPAAHGGRRDRWVSTKELAADGGSPIGRVLQALEANDCEPGDSGMARCPAHDDHNPSLSFAEGDDGRALIKCHAGCETEEVVEALGLEMRDLFPSEQAGVVDTYVYQDESGAVIARKVRTVRAGKKSFYWERPDGNGGWLPGLGGVDPGLYRADEVRGAIETGRPIWVVEGEKDVESLRQQGEVATCNPDGAGPHKWRPEYTEALSGAEVTVVADRDEPGYRHALAIVTALEDVTKSVSVCEALEGKDVSDHLSAGLELNELVPLSTIELEERAGVGAVAFPEGADAVRKAPDELDM
jgi:5S rRNA maturation endonuclease (ribonuclease M5)